MRVMLCHPLDMLESIRLPFRTVLFILSSYASGILSIEITVTFSAGFRFDLSKL